MSALKTIPVGIIVERRKAASQWIDYVWRPSVGLAACRKRKPWTMPVARRRRHDVLCRRGDDRIVPERDRAIIATISPAINSLWVVLRPTESDPPYSLLAVTADPSEGEAFSETGADLVEVVPLPDNVREAMIDFVAEHHVEQTFFKRQARSRRSRSARRGAIRSKDGGRAMSEPDDFLSRWSRRKLEPSSRDGRSGRAGRRRREATARRRGLSSAPDAPASAQEQPQRSRPSISRTCRRSNSITAGTDIRDFLKPGVPMSLTRAALRRAWPADPAIRDFIGLAENQWDFTEPNPSPASARSIRPRSNDCSPRSSARPRTPRPQCLRVSPSLRNRRRRKTQSQRAKAATLPIGKMYRPMPANASTSETVEQSATDDTAERAASHRNKENDAAQNESADGKLNYAHVRHGHGSALPT